jgi:hypothetical protein
MYRAVRQKPMAAWRDPLQHAFMHDQGGRSMKLIRMLAVGALLASSHLVYGQGETQVMTVNVPFAFTAGSVSMPAGRYVISRVQDFQLWKLTAFGHPGVYVTITPRELRKAPDTSRLVFNHDATGYALSQIQQGAQTDIAQVVQPHKSTKQELAFVTAEGR